MRMKTKLFGSVSIAPGGTGTFFYNLAFASLQIDAIYKAQKCNNFEEVKSVVKSRTFSGLSISMPFKNQSLDLCNELDESARLANSVNTLVYDDSHRLIGYSADLYGVRKSLEYLSEGEISILGDGAISTIYQLELSRMNREFRVYSRKRNNWNSRHSTTQNLINCTSIGMTSHESPVTKLNGCTYIVDLVINSRSLKDLANSMSIKFFSGMDFYREVFTNQFNFYTGKSITNSLYKSIEEAWIHENF